MIPVESSWILVGGFLALLALLLLFGIPPRRQVPRPKALEEVGRRLRGKPETWNGEPAIGFTWHGDKAILCDGQETTLTLQSDLLTKPRISMTSELKFSAAVTVEGVSGMSVSGGEIGQVAEFLSPLVRRVLQDLLLLRRNRPDARLIIELGPSIKVNLRPAVKSEELARFAMLSLQLAEHARLFAQRDTGVTIVRQESSAEGLCQICGVAMDGSAIKCARCATPHHQECWEYTGECSTFACKERRFVR